jgi:hypothetical protein
MINLSYMLLANLDPEDKIDCGMNPCKCCIVLVDFLLSAFTQGLQYPHGDFLFTFCALVVFFYNGEGSLQDLI